MENLTSEKPLEKSGEDEKKVIEIIEEQNKFKRMAGKIKSAVGYDKKEKRFYIGKFHIKRKVLIILLVIAAIILSFMACSSNSKKKMLEAMQPQNVTVEKRTIEQKVTGSAVIKPKDSYSIMTITTGEVTADYINEGDKVQKGDKLYQFDSETPQNSVDSAEIALKKAQQAYKDAQESLADLNVRSDISGTVSEVFIKQGDFVQGGAKVAAAYSDDYMKIRVPFNETDTESISVGSDAELTVSGTGNGISGRVTAISSSSVTTASHSKVRYVTIEVRNPGALTNSDKATAQVGDVACSDAGQFEYINEHTICAETSGKIASVSISQGDSVKSGQTIAKLDSSSAQSAAYTAKLTVDDAKLGLERAKKGVNDYTITAPISGTVVTKNNKAGDKVDSSNATTPMCIIYDMSSVQFDLNVDEIDVAKIKVGQEVTVTADAVSDKTFKGVVEKVSLNGTSANGVTNYPVTVAIADYGELLPGMNIDAEIIVDKAENVISIPVGSLVRGNIVYVQGDKEREDDNAPEGYKSVEVKTGISDDNFIEIKSGLNENDVVRGQEVDRTSDLQKMMMQGMEGEPEEGDGPPSGGGPHGGGGPNGGASGGQQ